MLHHEKKNIEASITNFFIHLTKDVEICNIIKKPKNLHFFFV